MKEKDDWVLLSYPHTFRLCSSKTCLLIWVFTAIKKNKYTSQFCSLEINNSSSSNTNNSNNITHTDTHTHTHTHVSKWEKSHHIKAVQKSVSLFFFCIPSYICGWYFCVFYRFLAQPLRLSHSVLMDRSQFDKGINETNTQIDTTFFCNWANIKDSNDSTVKEHTFFLFFLCIGNVSNTEKSICRYQCTYILRLHTKICIYFSQDSWILYSTENECEQP